MDYIGNELELFKVAHNWKSYYAGFFKEYLTGDVLEVGAGIGETTHSLCNGKQNSWLCLEPDKALTDIIQQKKESGYLPKLIDIKTGFIEDIDSDLKFDAILYIDVIEHIENDSEELLKAFHYLKPGGRLIILVPAHNFLFTAFDKAIGHYRRYNKKMLLQAVPKALRLIELSYLDSIGLSASIANKFFLKQSQPKLKQVKFWDKYMVSLSKIIDRAVFYKLGKSVLGIWQKPLE